MEQINSELSFSLDSEINDKGIETTLCISDRPNLVIQDSYKVLFDKALEAYSLDNLKDYEDIEAIVISLEEGARYAREQFEILSKGLV